MSNKKSSKYCLLLTSTIELRNPEPVLRRDTRTRLDDYKQALRQWLTKQKSFGKIVFVENSGYPLDELKKIVAENNPYEKEVEFLQFKATGKDLTDESYAELNRIGYAMNNSRLLNSAEFFSYSPGQVFIKNIDSICAHLPENFHAVGAFERNLVVTQTQVLFFEKKFFTERIFDYAKANISTENSAYFNTAVAKAILLGVIDDYRWYPLPVEPHVIGMDTSKNISLSRPWLTRLWGTIISRLYHRYYKNIYRKEQKHLLDKWKLQQKDYPTI